MHDRYLIEGEIKPGDVKKISMSLNRLDRLKATLSVYKKQLTSLAGMQVPSNAKQNLEELIRKIEEDLVRVKGAIDSLQEKMEERSHDAPIKLHNFFMGLMKHCNNILTLYKILNRNKKWDDMLVMQRGIRKTTSDAIYGRPYESRKPKDSNSDIDWLVNISMETLDLPARRNNSIFVTGDSRHASSYGNTYIIFPVDGFDFTWSPVERDLVLDSYTLGSTGDTFIDKTKIKEFILKLIEELPEETVKQVGITGSSTPTIATLKKISRAIEEGVIDQAYKKYLIDCVKTTELNNKIKTKLKFSTKELGSAILSEHEIYVRGNYYGLRATEKNLKFIKQMLDTKLDTTEEQEAFLNTIFGSLPPERIPGEVVKTPDKKLATVTKWKGINTEVTYLTSDLYLNSKTYPTTKLTVVDTNIDEYPKAGSLVIVKEKKIGLVTRTYSPFNIQVYWEDLWSPRGVDKASLTPINLNNSFNPGQVVIGIAPHYDSADESVYGRVYVVVSQKDNKTTCKQITSDGSLTKKTYNINSNHLVHITDKLATTFFNDKQKKYIAYTPPEIIEPVKTPKTTKKKT